MSLLTESRAARTSRASPAKATGPRLARSERQGKNLQFVPWNNSCPGPLGSNCPTKIY